MSNGLFINVKVRPHMIRLDMTQQQVPEPPVTTQNIEPVGSWASSMIRRRRCPP
ncbi:TPA: hypothetical protein I8273_004746 [Aeromonas hydrophila]|nr:hypothetical protein [Aeromonas hydrophila]HAT2639201.1 hypothetical protein [Aeromonas hydrophila]HAT3424403.1 hypothetical protein [Aeromonas hydrophila]HAT3534386.1 hypothetical protein [Aeromonas hydrophila]